MVVYINIMILVVLTLGFLISKKRVFQLDWIKNNNDDWLNFLYPLSALILDKLGLSKSLNQKEKVRDCLQALNFTGKGMEIQKKYWCRKLAKVLLLLFIFNMLSLCYVMGDTESSKLMDGKYLMRPKGSVGIEKVELTVLASKYTEDKDLNKGINNYTKNITFQVESRHYNKEELENLFLEAKKYIDQNILGDNESTSYIDKDLNLISFIPQTNITVDWSITDFHLINLDGTVRNQSVTTEGILTTITAILTCQGESVEYPITLRIMPRTYHEQEVLYHQLEEELEMIFGNSRMEDRIELPSKVGGFELTWITKNKSSGLLFFLLGIIASCLAWVFQDQELNKKMKDRNKQLLYDYPEFISKFTLLINAGMTIKQTWLKVAQDYEKQKEINPKIKRYAYEELLITAHELRLGVTESSAYERYGKRVGQLSYLKFSTFIAQNLKKGSKGLSDILNKEAMEAFEHRKETAKKLGEEAGTKLLFPLMMMLVIVLLIILIPAFLSFGF